MSLDKYRRKTLVSMHRVEVGEEYFKIKGKTLTWNQLTKFNKQLITYRKYTFMVISRYRYKLTGIEINIS